jgi:hypothetical protein
MANTTNFGWETPDDTDLVKDGAAAIRTLGSAIDTSLADLEGGTTGQILSKTSNTDMDFTWITNDVGDITAVSAGTGITGGGTTGAITITNDMATTITASGDIVVGTGSGTYDNLPIGTTNQVLTADTTVSPYKVKWATPSSGTPTFVGCSLTKSANQTISTATTTAITFDTELFDTDGFHSTATNTSRITIPTGKAGKYLLTGTVNHFSNGTGFRQGGFRKNGSAEAFYNINANTGDSTSGSISEILDLAVADYVEMVGYQNSGGNLAILGGSSYFTNFQVQYLGA